MTENQKLREALSELIEAYNRAGPELSRAERAVDRMRLIAAHEALALPTAAPEMPLSMNQFGRLVELTREHLTDNTFVYKATSKAGDTCHFGVESAAKAWAKGGTVEAIKVREFKLHTSGPTADHLPDAGEMIQTAEPVGERELFERTMMDKFGWERKDFKTDGRDFYMDGNTVTAWMAWQARAALSAAPTLMTCLERDDASNS